MLISWVKQTCLNTFSYILKATWKGKYQSTDNTKKSKKKEETHTEYIERSLDERHINTCKLN
jgi:hypothetical protein